MRVTIREVASRAGVSPMTVSRVINESPRVSPATRRRVEAVVEELGYVPNRLARGLIRQRTGTLGLIVPDVANPFFTLVVRGAEEVAWRAGYHGDLVQGDSVAGARRLVEHLIGLGHLRIGMVTETSEVSTARDRLSGYRQALERAGIEFRPELVAESSAIDPRAAHDATLRLLDLP